MKITKAELQEAVQKIAHYCVYKEMMAEVDSTQLVAIAPTDYKVMVKLLKKVLDNFQEIKNSTSKTA